MQPLKVVLQKITSRTTMWMYLMYWNLKIVKMINFNLCIFYNKKDDFITWGNVHNVLWGFFKWNYTMMKQ